MSADNIQAKIRFRYHMIFYTLRYIPGQNAGWYLTKRRWLWWVLSIVLIPWNMLVSALSSIIEYYDFVNTYRSHWVKSSGISPLTYKQRKSIVKRLMR